MLPFIMKSLTVWAVEICLSERSAPFLGHHHLIYIFSHVASYSIKFDESLVGKKAGVHKEVRAEWRSGSVLGP